MTNIQGDKAPAKRQKMLKKFKTMVIIPNPRCTLDLAPYDFALFPKLKTKLKGRRFETESDIQRESQAVLHSVKENDFHGTFQVWKKLWDRCIRSQGDSFEGDSNQS
jgi:hypothetical protein